MADIATQMLTGIPPVTRVLLAASALLTVLVALDLVSSFSLFFSLHRVVAYQEWWRPLTALLFFGNLGIHFFWNAYMMVVYCGQLEEEAYAGRRADFVWMIVVIMTAISVMACLTPHTLFLSSALITAFTYIWGRKNPNTQMMIIFFTVKAPYLPWALMAVSWVAGFSIWDNVIGIIAGHIVYFLEDVFPLMPVAKERKLLKAPATLSRMLD